MAIFVTGSGNYNSLFSKIFEIFDYFCTVVPYFEYFRVIFVNLSFAFSSAFVLRVSQSTEPLYIFECKFEYEKKTFRLSRKWKIRKKNPFAVLVGTCGHLWEHVGTYEHLWALVGTCGHLWALVGTCGHFF